MYVDVNYTVIYHHIQYIYSNKIYIMHSTFAWCVFTFCRIPKVLHTLGEEGHLEGEDDESWYIPPILED